MTLDRLNAMLPTEQEAELFRTRHELTVVFVAAADGSFVTAGRTESLKHTGLSETLVGDTQAMVRLTKSLKGRPLPQIWVQGPDVAYATIVSERLVVLFETTGLDATAQYWRSKELDLRAREELVPVV